MIKAIFLAIVEQLKIKRVKRVKTALLDDDLSIEMLEIIAKNYKYHFEVIRPDGTIFRFNKYSNESVPENGGTW